jgi:hypothetical protein
VPKAAISSASNPAQTEHRFVIIDGQIASERYRHLSDERGKDSLLAPDAIAELYLQLHRQPRSAWSHEIDVRPWSEKF